jgi:hypothetical protein
MLTRLFFLGVLLALPASALFAQKAMEMFTPIGDSHGVSNIYSIIGVIATVNEENRSLTVSESSGVKLSTWSQSRMRPPSGWIGAKRKVRTKLAR